VPAVNGYDYVDQDPVNNFDLEGAGLGDSELQDAGAPWPSAAFEALGDTGSVAVESTATSGGVYVLVDEEGEVVYVGRSKDLASRRRFWAAKRSNLRFRVAARTDSYAQQRGVEQRLMNRYRPTLNAIRGISRANPDRAEYLQAARDYYNHR
jgi:hypothetical protein